jgi:microcystin-dependent protein
VTEPYIGEIQIFGFNFNPYGFAFCNGATMAIQQNTALFSLLGTTYGGNGQTTYQLPNFTGRAAVSQGQGNGLTPRELGEVFGSANVSLLSTEVPAHTHGLNAYSQTAPGSGTGAPVSNGGLSFLAASTTTRTFNASPNTTMAPGMLGPSNGASQPHENSQPYLALNFCIALQGIFPSRP